MRSCCALLLVHCGLAASASVTLLDGSREEPGPNLGQALEMAAQQAMTGVEFGVKRLENLEHQNEDLTRRNQGLEHRASLADSKAEHTEESSDEARNMQVLKREATDLSGKVLSVENDKKALLLTVQRMMHTNATVSMEAKVIEARNQKDEAQRHCVQVQEDLKQQLASQSQKADAARAEAERVQKSNLKMRTEGRQLQEQADRLLSSANELRRQNEKVEDSLEAPLEGNSTKGQVAEAAAVVQQNIDLRKSIAKIKEQLLQAQHNVRDLASELDTMKHSNTEYQDELKTSYQMPKGSQADDGSAEIVQSLQEENADLQKSSAVARAELQTLREHARTLEFDKSNLITTLQQSVRDSDLTKMELKKQLSERMRLIAQKDREHVQSLQAKVAAANHTVSRRSLSLNTTNATAHRHAAPHPAAPAEDDPIMHMRHEVRMEHFERVEMEAVADAAAKVAPTDKAATSDDIGLRLAAQRFLDATTTTTTMRPDKQKLRDFLDGDAVQEVAPSPPHSENLSPVDALDPETVAQVQAQQNQQVQATQDQGDEVSRLLDKAEAAVSDVTKNAH